MTEDKRFEIDFFEFAFLVEACIPPQPIARRSFWDKVINHYYKQLTDSERARLYEWTTRNPCFDLKNEDCQLFAARFNPANQYKVTTLYEGKTEVHDCFFWKKEYHTSKSRSILKKYIIQVEKANQIPV
jgi:hypothetical protein